MFGGDPGRWRGRGGEGFSRPAATFADPWKGTAREEDPFAKQSNANFPSKVEAKVARNIALQPFAHPGRLQRAESSRERNAKTAFDLLGEPKNARR